MEQLQELTQSETKGLAGEVIENRRILIVDDNKAIHEDFTKILPFEPEELDTFDDMEQDLFSHLSNKGYDRPAPDPAYYELSHAYQGEEPSIWLPRRRRQANRSLWCSWMCACPRVGMESRRLSASGPNGPTWRW
jgi:hypothetical protein